MTGRMYLGFAPFAGEKMTRFHDPHTENQSMKTHTYSRFSLWAGVLALLLGAQAARAEPLVYIPLGGDGRIVVVDAARDEVVGSISGLKAVHGLAGTPDGKYLIAGSYAERSADGVPAKPEGMSEDEHASHHMAKVNQPGESARKAVSTVSVIRTSDRAIVRAIDVPGAVHHVSVSPDGRLAVVTHPDAGGVSAIDLASYEVVASIATGSAPNYSVFSPDTSRLYVSSAGDGAIAVVNTATWAVERTIAVGTTPEHLVVSRNGKTLYVSNVEDGTVSLVDTAAGQTTSTIKIGSTLHGIDLSKDGRSLFVAALGDDQIARVDLATGTVKTVSLSPGPYHLTTIKGTNKIYVSSSDEPKVWVIDQANLHVIGEIAIGGKGHQMAIAPGL